MMSIPKIPCIPEEERTPVVVALLEIIALLKEQLQALKDEIARLKGHKPKPNIQPSRLEKDSQSKEKNGTGTRPGSAKRSKTGELEIHETRVLKAENVPVGSTFKGYEASAFNYLAIHRGHGVETPGDNRGLVGNARNGSPENSLHTGLLGRG